MIASEVSQPASHYLLPRENPGETSSNLNSYHFSFVSLTMIINGVDRGRGRYHSQLNSLSKATTKASK